MIGAIWTAPVLVAIINNYDELTMTLMYKLISQVVVPLAATSWCRQSLANVLLGLNDLV